MASKLIFSPLKLVFQIALCFSQILFHKCKILTLCHLHCMIWMYNIRKFSIYTNIQQALSFILLPFCNLKCNLLFFAPCSVHFEIFLLATQNLVFQNINPLSRRSINHHPAAKVNANNIQIYSTLKTMVLATPADAIFIISDLIHSYIFSRNFKERFTLFGFDLHVLA